METEVLVNGSTIKWYQKKGYHIPVRKKQTYYINKNGERKKNGTKSVTVARGTKIMVDVKDLSPKSNETVKFICTECEQEHTTRAAAFFIKLDSKCTGCKKKELKNTGCHSYWVKKLITDNPNAKCDISGETDKRFLVLHHLLNSKSGGKNEFENYVILSYNYHLAFHNSIGGTNVACTPKQYIEFKQNEMAKILTN